MRILSIAFFILLLVLTGCDKAVEQSTQAILYKTPQCKCCADYATYLRENGFDVQVIESSDLAAIKKEHGIPADLEGCHTTLIGDYVVEGHVPVSAIKKLLTEQPDIKGVSLAGMPAGSPGMTGKKIEPFSIYEITDEGDRKIFMQE